MSKQDRTYPRTATDLERKYNFGRNFSEILGVAKDAQTHAYNAENSVKEWTQRVVGIEGNFAEITAEQNNITLRVEGVEKNYSLIRQEVNSITLRVQDTEDNYSTIKQTANDISLRVETVESGYSELSGEVNGISNNVTTLSSTVSELSVGQNGITARVEAVETTYNGISGEVSTLKESYSEVVLTQDSITSRVEGVENNYITLSGTVGDIEEAYNGISVDLKTLKTSYSETAQTQNGITARVEAVETTYNGISGEVSTIKESYAELSVKQNGITARVEECETTYNTLSGEVEDLEQSVGGISNDVSVLKTSYAEIVVEKDSIKSRVDSVEENYTTLSGELSDIKKTYSTIEQTDSKIATSVSSLEEKYDGELSDIKKTYSTIEQTSKSIEMAVWQVNDEIRTDINAELSLKVGKDENGNLIGKIHIGADQLTIDTDNFKLKKNGDVYISGEVVTEGAYGKTVLSDGRIYFGGDYSSIRYNEVNDIIIDAINDVQIQSPTWINAQNNLYVKIGVYNDSDIFMQFYDDFETDTLVGEIKMQNGAFDISAQGGKSLNLWGSNTNGLLGSWRCDSGLQNTSDINYKNSISDISEKYSILFDLLRPVIHKYNDGQSGRFHIGYIAQEVDEAITKAGLTRQDFAALCIQNQGAENEKWALRYTEFVPLNTYEIQKLKKEVAELKARIGA
jgi:chromosome segregation ATPase